jgi:replicative DNA helicase
MRAMREQGFVIDQITLAEHLSRQKELEAVGGKTYLESLAEGLPQRLSIESYCRIVKDKSLLREIIQASTAAVYHAADDSDTALEVVSELEARIISRR